MIRRIYVIGKASRGLVKAWTATGRVSQRDLVGWSPPPPLIPAWVVSKHIPTFDTAFKATFLDKSLFGHFVQDVQLVPI